MRAAALYGVLLVVVFEVFTKRLPQPTGSISMLGLFTAQLTWITAICWRRTGLPYATASMAVPTHEGATIEVVWLTRTQVGGARGPTGSVRRS